MKYMLEITSWENDADCYNMKSLKNLSRDHVEFYIRVVKLFTSCNSYNGENRGFGSTDLYTTESAVNAAIDSIVLEFMNNNKSVPKYWYVPVEERDEYFSYIDFLFDLGLGAGYESDYRRVFDGFRVYEVPEELKDVTLDFTN